MRAQVIPAPLKKVDGSFSPEQIAQLDTAFRMALQLMDHLHPEMGLREVIAKAIIDIARERESNDPSEVATWAIKRLRLPLMPTNRQAGRAQN
ncbi:MAG TPA: hypothetical protein VE999_06070 [Gemmataceae bacterium]|nr:hypothetical protein [Gemmataceae bacterium]